MTSQQKPAFTQPNRSDVTEVSIRAATHDDNEMLRHWKNHHCHAFFHQQHITSEQQKQWFTQYCRHQDNFMFILEHADGQPFGCIGIRKINAQWDLYNIILGRADYGAKGLMSRGLDAVLARAETIESIPVSCQVLKNNPAISWYRKNGFAIIAEHHNHYTMRLQSEKRRSSL